MSGSRDNAVKDSPRRRSRAALERWFVEADALLDADGQIGVAAPLPAA